MSDNELLLAVAELFDKKLETQLQPLRDDIRDIKLTLENNITPNIQLLAENYVPAAKRYEKGSTEITLTGSHFAGRHYPAGKSPDRRTTT